MAETLTQDERLPAIHPPVDGVAAGTDLGLLWERIEAFVAWRWTPRPVLWVVEGPGDWAPPLRPATLGLVEGWRNESWEAVTLPASPFGGLVLGCGLWRIEAEVGRGPIPAGVQEAVRRLAAYLAGAPSDAPSGAASYSVKLGTITEDIKRDPDHLAWALINSGAADLLRPYRRA